MPTQGVGRDRSLKRSPARTDGLRDEDETNYMFRRPNAFLISFQPGMSRILRFILHYHAQTVNLNRLSEEVCLILPDGHHMEMASQDGLQN